MDFNKLHEEITGSNVSAQRHNEIWSIFHSELHAIGKDGRTAEANKDYELAVKKYNEVISFTKSYSVIDRIQNYGTYLERLAIVYRKLKLYAEEVELLEYHISLCERDNAYNIKSVQERLIKAQELLSKTKDE